MFTWSSLTWIQKKEKTWFKFTKVSSCSVKNDTRIWRGVHPQMSTTKSCLFWRTVFQWGLSHRWGPTFWTMPLLLCRVPYTQLGGARDKKAALHGYWGFTSPTLDQTSAGNDEGARADFRTGGEVETQGGRVEDKEEGRGGKQEGEGWRTKEQRPCCQYQAAERKRTSFLLLPQSLSGCSFLKTAFTPWKTLSSVRSFTLSQGSATTGLTVKKGLDHLVLGWTNTK